MNLDATVLVRAGRRVLPAPKIRLLVLIQLIDAVGTGVFLSGSAVIYIRVFGFTPGSIGTAVGCAGAAGLLASIFAGLFVDRIGPRKAMVLLTAFQGVTYLLFFLVRGFLAFAALLCLIAMVDYAKGNAFVAVLAAQLEGQPTMVHSRAVIRSYFNAGVLGGSSAAALLLELDSRWLLGVFVGANSLSYGVCALLAARVPRPDAGESGRRARRRLGALRDRRFLMVVALMSVLGLHSAVMLVALPIWILTHTTVPGAIVPLLLALNTVLVVTTQVLASRNAERVKGAVRAARQSSYLLAGGCLALIGAAVVGRSVGIALVTVAVVALTSAELRQAAGSWGLSFALAPADARAEYMGAFSMCMPLTAIYGAPLSVGITSGLGKAGWVILAALVLSAGAVIVPAAHGAAESGIASGRLAPEVLG